MPWYVLQDYRGWTMTTNCSKTAKTMFKRLHNARGERRLRYVKKDGKVIWPKQMTLAFGEDP